MDLSSYASNSILLIVLLFIYQTILKSQMRCRTHICLTLLFVLHLNRSMSESYDEIKITTPQMLFFFILRVIYYYVSSHFIAHRICKTKYIEHSEKSMSTELMSTNNNLNKFISSKAWMKCERCYTVCGQWDAHQVSDEAQRLATFRESQPGADFIRTFRPMLLARSGLYYNNASSSVQCCRCQRSLSESDFRDPNTWHEEQCEFLTPTSVNYRDLFLNQEPVIHEQILERRRRYRSETAHNAAGSEQEGPFLQAATQSTDEGTSILPSGDSTSSTLDRSNIQRSNTTSLLDGPPESTTFNEHLGPYSRTSAVLSVDHFINSEPAMMLCTEITPTGRVTEDVFEWQSQTVPVQDSAVSESWASTQSMRENLPASHQGTARRNSANIRRHQDNRQRRDPRQHQCCRII